MFTDRTDHNRFAEQLNARLGNEKQKANANSGASRHACPQSTGGSVGTAPAPKGHNNPPTPIDSAKEALTELGAWLKEHPRFTSKAEADQAYAYVERTRIALTEARKERDERIKPHNEAVSKIRAFFDIVREKTKTNPGGTLERAYSEIKRRLTEYDNEVEALRIAEANRLRAEAEVKEQEARAAEAAEQEAIINAAQGECTDVGAAIENADTKFAEFQKTARTAAVAARDVPVRHASVMGNRAGAMRNVPVLTVTDATAAIQALGLTPHISEAILTSARLYRKEFGELPPGVTETFERRM